MSERGGEGDWFELNYIELSEALGYCRILLKRRMAVNLARKGLLIPFLLYLLLHLIRIQVDCTMKANGRQFSRATQRLHFRARTTQKKANHLLATETTALSLLCFV